VARKYTLYTSPDVEWCATTQHEFLWDGSIFAAYYNVEARTYGIGKLYSDPEHIHWSLNTRLPHGLPEWVVAAVIYYCKNSGFADLTIEEYLRQMR
jgi:hypothetical protein